MGILRGCYYDIKWYYTFYYNNLNIRYERTCKYKCDTCFINYSKTPFNTTYIDYKSLSPISS